MISTLEHLFSSKRKANNMVKVLKALKLKIEFTSDGRWFNIVEDSS